MPVLLTVVARFSYGLAVVACCLASAVGCSNRSGGQPASQLAPNANSADIVTKRTVPVALPVAPNQELIDEINSNYSAWIEGKPFDFKPAAAKVVKLLEAGLDEESIGIVKDFGRGCVEAGAYEPA
jgi:hypothetical protein